MSTPRLLLNLPALDEPDWDARLRENYATLDRAIGSFAVLPAEAPGESASLGYLVRGGVYNNAGVVTVVANFAPATAPASATTYLYLTQAGTLGTGAAWPAAGAGKYAPLAILTTDATKITNIFDCRLPLPLLGS